MKHDSLPSYAELSKALSHTNLKLHASQVHGLVCGLLSGNPKTTSAWEELVTGGKETPKAHELLQSLYDQSAKQLGEMLFEFQLLLPSDEDELPHRAEALTLWCQGFLTGLKMAEVQIIGRKPSELTEAIDDMIEIAKMNYEQVVASEEDEAAYTELVEYVRMAVILIYEELRANDNTAPSSKTPTNLH